MASFDFYTVGDVLIFAQTRLPSYPLELAPSANVAVATTIGRVVRTEIRGLDRKRLVLHWKDVGATQLANFLSWFATYGGMKVPFKIELPGDATELPAATKLRVRAEGATLDYSWVSYGKFDVNLSLVEDLETGSVVMGNLLDTTVDVAEGATYVDVPVTAAVATYHVKATPSCTGDDWATTTWVTAKTTTQFRVNFSTPAPAGAHLDVRADT